MRSEVRGLLLVIWREILGTDRCCLALLNLIDWKMVYHGVSSFIRLLKPVWLLKHIETQKGSTWKVAYWKSNSSSVRKCPLQIPSGKLTKLLKIPIFNVKINHKSPFSIAMLVCHRISTICHGRRPPQVAHAGPSDGCFWGCGHRRWVQRWFFVAHKKGMNCWWFHVGLMMVTDGYWCILMVTDG